MNVNYITVNRGEAKIVTDKDQVTALATLNLGDDIAITLFNPAHRKVGLARNIDVSELSSFVESIIDNVNIDPSPTIQVRLFGGKSDSKSAEVINRMLQHLDAIDAGRDVLNIISADTGHKNHPESFKITAFDGVVGEISSAA